jgi:anti-sigma-K factor RskA
MSEKSDTTPGHDVQILAGEYVLGTLSAVQRAEVQERLNHDPALRRAVDGWEARLFALTEMAEPLPPSSRLWHRIERSLDELSTAPPIAVRTSRKRPTRWWDSLNVLRTLAGLGLAASVILGTSLLTQSPPQTMPSYLVVLVAPQDKAPGWVIQANAAREIQLIPLSETEVPEDKALQFWTKADDWQGPVSLGLVKPGEVFRVPLDKLPPLQPNQLFELTLEKSTGSPINKPTGPIQFIGRAVKVI